MSFYTHDFAALLTEILKTGKVLDSIKDIAEDRLFPPLQLETEEEACNYFTTMIVILEKLGFVCTSPKLGVFETKDMGQTAFWIESVPLDNPREFKVVKCIIATFCWQGFSLHAVQLFNQIMLLLYRHKLTSSGNHYMTSILMPQTRTELATVFSNSSNLENRKPPNNHPIIDNYKVTESERNVVAPSTFEIVVSGKDPNVKRTNVFPICWHKIIAATQKRSDGQSEYMCTLSKVSPEADCMFRQLVQ